MELVNPDRQMTESQLRFSRRGFLVHEEEDKHAVEDSQPLLQPVIEEEKVIDEVRPNAGMNDQPLIESAADNED